MARRATSRRKPTRKPRKTPAKQAKPRTGRRPTSARRASQGPTERLLTLIATLLDARAPLTLAELRERLPPGAYEGNPAAVERKFERDKEVLLELGIPIRYVTDPEEADAPGYVVDRERLFLPDLELSPDESAALFLAGASLLQQGEFPYRDDLERALEKVRLRGELPRAQGAADHVLFHYPSLDGGPDVARRLSVIEDALERRKTLTLVYRSGGDLDGARRRVDPYGLFCRHGRWLLAGYSHERTAIRVFTVQKIEHVEVNTARPRSPDFEVPPGFQLRRWVQVPPWRYERHAPVAVEIDVDPAFAWLAEQELETGGVPTIERAVRFHVLATNQDALVEWLLGMGTKARVVSPERLRQAVRERLDAALAAWTERGR